MNRQRLDSPLVYVGAHNVYYVKLPVKVLYFTIHIHTQINQYVVISDFPPVSVEKFNPRILADEISHTVDIFNTIRRFIHVTLLMQR